MGENVVLNTSLGALRIELFVREAPAASSHFLEQHRAHAWEAAKFYMIEQAALRFGPGKVLQNTLHREERHPRIRFDKRGMVAYARETTSELLFCRGPGAAPVTGTIFGCVAPESLFILESIANKPSNGGLLLYPVGIAGEKPHVAAPEPKRRRIKIQLRHESDEDDLPQSRPQVSVAQLDHETKELGGSMLRPESGRASSMSGLSDELRDLLAFEARLKELQHR